MSISLGEGKELWVSVAWDRKQPVFLEQPSTDVPRSKSINSRVVAAASTATVSLDIRAKTKNHSIPPPTCLGPSPTQKLILLQFPSAPLLASSLGKQSQGKNCLCSLWACAARTGWHWDATALDGTGFLLPTAAGAHRHHPQQQAPFAPPAQHSGTSSLTWLITQTIQGQIAFSLQLPGTHSVLDKIRPGPNI